MHSPDSSNLFGTLTGSGGWTDLQIGLHDPRQALPGVPGYTVLRMLGEGGMGAVYEARREKPRHTVAIKILKPATTQGARGAELLKRFERESEILARLKHPCIAHIYEQGIAQTPLGPTPFLAMELVAGKNLVEYAYDAGMKIPQRLELLARVADGVHHAHERGVVHRDLKPGNVLVDSEGQPKVLDFGIARLADSELAITTLQHDVPRVLGTLRYMAPEQAAGDLSRVDKRSDVYSLGVMLFELLTGSFPHNLAERGVADAIRIIRDEEPTRLSSLNATLRGDIDTIVATALAREPGRRYATAAELAEDIRRFLANQPIRARRPSTVYRLRKYVSRNRMLVGSAAAIVAVTSAALVVSLRYAQQASESLQSEKLANDETEKALVREKQLLRETYMQGARVAAGRGAWKEALLAYDQARTAGYPDQIEIDIGRHTALEGLAKLPEANALLDDLSSRPNLGKYAGAVMLRAGQRKLSANGEDGWRMIEQSLRLGLSQGDEAFARGFLAETMPEAVHYFEQALEHDPVHRDAMGFRILFTWLMGEVEQARRQLAVARNIFPDDPQICLLDLLVAAFQNDRNHIEAVLGKARKADPQSIEVQLGPIFTAMLELPATVQEIPWITGGQFASFDRHGRFAAQVAKLSFMTMAAATAASSTNSDTDDESLLSLLRQTTQGMATLSREADLESAEGILKAGARFGFPRSLETTFRPVFDHVYGVASRTDLRGTIARLVEIGKTNRISAILVLAALTQQGHQDDPGQVLEYLEAARKLPSPLDLRRPILIHEILAAGLLEKHGHGTPQTRERQLAAVRELMQVQPLSLGEALFCVDAIRDSDTLLSRQLLDHARRIDADNLHVHLYSAITEYEAGNYPAAWLAADAATRKQPDNSLALDLRNKARARLGKIGKGDIADYPEAIEMKQVSPP